MHHFNIHIKTFVWNLIWEAFSCSTQWSWVCFVIKMALNSQSSFLCLPGAGIISFCHHAWQNQQVGLTHYVKPWVWASMMWWWELGWGWSKKTGLIWTVFTEGKPYSLLHFFLSHVTHQLTHFAFFVLYVCVCRACLCVSMCAGMPIRCLLHILTTLQSKSLCEPKRFQFCLGRQLAPGNPCLRLPSLVLETSCPANTNTMEHSACARDPNLGSKNLPESALPTESSLQPQVVNPIFIY